MTMVQQSSNRSRQPSGLAEVLEVVLDKGIVIDAYVRVALVGIELVTVDARIVVASVDTYLRFAERVGRLGIESKPTGLPGLIQGIQEGGAKSKTRGAIAGLREGARDTADDLAAKLRRSSGEQAESRRPGRRG